MRDEGPYTLGLMGPPPRPGGRPSLAEIRPALLVGEYPLPADAAWLHADVGVTVVVSLQDDADIASKGVREPSLVRAYETHGLRYHRIPVPDGDDEAFAARLAEIVGLLRTLVGAGERVYLHCNAGYNRAPTAAVAFLVVHEGLELLSARDEVKSLRSCVPYMGVLETFVRTLVR